MILKMLKNKKKIINIFKDYHYIKLVYLFGSQASGKTGPLSDYDFAFYLKTKNRKKMSQVQFGLMDKLSRVLKTDKIDVVILNTLKSPELKFNIIKHGKLIYEKEPFKLILEPMILNQYFDFKKQLLKYNLTKDI